MQEVIRANARYWLRFLQNASGASPLPETDLRGTAKAIEAALRFPDLWDVTKSLAQAFHPHMEQRGFWADWDECLQVLIGCAQQQSDEQAETEMLLWRGTIQRQRGDFRAAAFFCLRAWKLNHHRRNELILAPIFSQLGDIYRLKGQHWRAELLCLTAVRCLDGEEQVASLAQAENRLGLVYFDQLRYADALPHFFRAEVLSRKVSDSYGLAKVLQNLGEMHRRNGDFEKALLYLKQAVEHYSAVGDEIYAATAQVNIGNVYLNQADWSHAESTYLDAETTLRRAGNSLDLAILRNNLGIVYTRLKVWDEAQVCFTRALEQSRLRGDVWMEANTLGEIGMLFYLARGDRAVAQSYLDEALRLVRMHNGENFALLRQELSERRKNLSDN